MKTIKLTQGYETMVSNHRYEELSTYKWHYNKGYAARKFMGKRYFMHNEILGVVKGGEHKDRNKLNNQDDNLRLATHSQNMANRDVDIRNISGYKGVDFHAKTKKWRARIIVNQNELHLGLFTCPKEAAQAYNEAAMIHFGEYACLNQICGPVQQ